LAFKRLSSLERYVALVIEFDPITGWRAGGIKIPGDVKKFFCPPLWQYLEKGIEMRLIVDPSIDPEAFKGLPGIQVIEGKTAINQKAKELFKPQYFITDRIFFEFSLKQLLEQGSITLSDLQRYSGQEGLKFLKERGCLGIQKRDPYQIPE